MIIDKLAKEGLIQPPKWLIDNLQFLGCSGSISYGVSSNTSDIDCFGYCIPPKDIVFPYANNIVGFGTNKERFRIWSKHHVKTLDGQKTYDFSIYNIVDYFNLMLENNPNMIDILFLPRHCILHSTQINEIIRENRKLFLSKLVFPKFRGYAYSQISKMINKKETTNEKRMKTIIDYGYDTKNAYHAVRLVLECEQILVEHDLDLERNKEILKSIRNGEWTSERLQDWFTNKRNLWKHYMLRVFCVQNQMKKK